jgi:hypothetical protein
MAANPLLPMRESHQGPIDVVTKYRQIPKSVSEHIMEEYGCRPLLRYRERWGDKRKLSLVGPAGRLDAAAELTVKILMEPEKFDYSDDDADYLVPPGRREKEVVTTFATERKHKQQQKAHHGDAAASTAPGLLPLPPPPPLPPVPQFVQPPFMMPAHMWGMLQQQQPWNQQQPMWAGTWNPAYMQPNNAAPDMRCEREHGGGSVGGSDGQSSSCGSEFEPKKVVLVEARKLAPHRVKKEKKEKKEAVTPTEEKEKEKVLIVKVSDDEAEDDSSDDERNLQALMQKVATKCARRTTLRKRKSSREEAVAEVEKSLKRSSSSPPASAKSMPVQAPWPKMKRRTRSPESRRVRGMGRGRGGGGAGGVG